MCGPTGPINQTTGLAIGVNEIYTNSINPEKKLGAMNLFLVQPKEGNPYLGVAYNAGDIAEVFRPDRVNGALTNADYLKKAENERDFNIIDLLTVESDVESDRVEGLPTVVTARSSYKMKEADRNPAYDLNGNGDVTYSERVYGSLTSEALEHLRAGEYTELLLTLRGQKCGAEALFPEE